jgi:hypothetical protein
MTDNTEPPSGAKLGSAEARMLGLFRRGWLIGAQKGVDHAGVLEDASNAMNDEEFLEFNRGLGAGMRHRWRSGDRTL